MEVQGGKKASEGKRAQGTEEAQVWKKTQDVGYPPDRVATMKDMTQMQEEGRLRMFGGVQQGDVKKKLQQDEERGYYEGHVEREHHHDGGEGRGHHVVKRSREEEPVA